ncbi:MAG: ester cyclase [Actinomycetota bacterium]|nr:ester cyclase [Actinomycetota bacterium]
MNSDGISLVRRGIEAVNAGTMAQVAPEILAPDFVRHDLAQAFPEFTTAGGVVDFVALLRSAIPDYNQEILDIFSADDRVAMRWVVRGTHRGELLGAAPSGNAISINGINLYRVAEGRIAEVWQLVDLAGLLRQLGILELKGLTP